MGSTTDKVSGVANQAAGKVKEAAGKATDSEKAMTPPGQCARTKTFCVLGRAVKYFEAAAAFKHNFEARFASGDFTSRLWYGPIAHSFLRG